MNKYLYKYMNLRANFFKEPMLRATPVFALNDPFEGQFNDKQIKNANTTFDIFYTEHGFGKQNEIDEHTINQLMEVTQSNLFSLGIVSLTEDYINPLMWSHYANEHKGVVIEFIKDIPLYEDSLKILDGKSSRFGKDYLGEIYEYPERIIYKREKQIFESYDELIPDSINDYHWKKFNKSILLTKANDWLYEKEHRSIVRLKDADRIICNDNEHIRKVCSDNIEIELIELENNKIQITYPREYEMHEEMGDESIKTEIYQLSSSGYDSSVMHFFRINPKCINGVYFGCKSNIEESMMNLKNNKELKHVSNLNKIKIDHYSYSLKSEKILIE